MDTDLDSCTCEACQKEVSIETPAGFKYLEDLSRLAGSYFDHPAYLVAVEDYEDETADLFMEMA